MNPGEHASLTASFIREIEKLDATLWPTDNAAAKISRFPLHIRERRAAEIRPKVVSIGPFYHGDPDFDGMAGRKLEFVKTIKDYTNPLPTLIMKSISFVGPARKFYSEPIDLNDWDFARMLLVDSCFIIGFLISLSSEMEERLVSLDWSIKEIRSDLLLLENQIPLFVVRKVYDILRTSWPAYHNLPEDFIHILRQFISMDIPWEFREVSLDEANHLLHYYWLCFLPNDLNEKSSRQGLSYVKLPKPVETTIPMSRLSPQEEHTTANWAENWKDYGAPRNIPNVIELSREARVIFKKSLHKEGQGFVASFHNGVMEMSSLMIDESRKIILTNLVGFEKSFKLSKRKVSSYMSLLDSLINTEKDVALLQKYGIVFNGLNNNSSAAEFFNEIGNMCTINYRKHLFEGLFREVNEYYNSKWNRRLASLHHNYFHNPWAVISVFAAGFLLFLATIQTILSAIQTHYSMDQNICVCPP
ncbi:hypothetical protein LUZ60_013832 [Juncus effusus]|nr:hypothetical protein LUZ60_013832 [Juncus effusus]